MYSAAMSRPREGVSRPSSRPEAMKERSPRREAGRTWSIAVWISCVIANFGGLEAWNAYKQVSEIRGGAAGGSLRSGGVGQRSGLEQTPHPAMIRTRYN